ncbi:MAG: hypothetical protein ACOYZ7_16960 [Chloroflexota bacterium]
MPTCPVCHGQYALIELQCSGYTPTGKEKPTDLYGKRCCCPRCQEDIYGWREKDKKESPLKKLGKLSPLVLPLVALVLGVTGNQPHWVGGLLAIVLSLVAFVILKNKAPAFRIANWAKPFQSGFGISLELIELGAFFVGLGMGMVTLIMMKYWILPPQEPGFMEKLIASIVYSLFFVLITLALTGMMVNAEVRALDGIMPQPVFTNTARLLNIVLKSARQQLGLDAEPTIENIERTADAGIQVVISLRRTESTTEKTGTASVSINRPAGTLTATRTKEARISESDEKGTVARWAITADMWGRIRAIDVRDWWTFVK